MPLAMFRVAQSNMHGTTALGTSGSEPRGIAARRTQPALVPDEAPRADRTEIGDLQVALVPTDGVSAPPTLG